MTKAKSTKRALLMSGLALLLCVSMLVGSTYAWFTDSVTSAGNKIVAGKLDIQLYLDNGSGYEDISASTESIFNMISNKAQNNNADTLWEPGKTQVAYLKIVNAGSLALKYSVALKITDVTKDLHKVMQYAITPDATRANPVTAWDADDGKAVVLGHQTVTDADVVMNPGDEHCFALSVHMLEEAGNQYQGGTLNFDLTILAGQANVEADSFDNLYDEDADYDGEISSTASLLAAFKNGGTYKVIDNVTTDSTVTVPEGVTVTLDLNDKTIAGTGEKQKHTIVNKGTLNIVGGTISSLGNDGGSAIYNYGTLTVKDAELNGAPFTAIDGWWPSYAVNNQGTMTITDSVINAEHGGVASTNGGVVTLNNVNITAGKDTKTSAAVYTNGGSVIINGGRYENIATDANATGASVINGAITVNGGTFIGRLENYYGTPVIKGGTFSVEPRAAFVADGYEVTNNGDGTWTVSATKVSDATELNSALNSGKVVELTQDVTTGSDFTAANTTIDLGNNTLTMTSSDHKTAGNVNVSNGTVDVSKGYFDLRPSADNEVVFENVVFENTTKSKTFGTCTNHVEPAFETTAVTANTVMTFSFKDCTFNNANAVFEAMSGYPTTINAVFENCTFNLFGSSDAIEIKNYITADITIKDCTFNITATASTGIVDAMSGSTVKVTFEGNNLLNGVAAVATTDPALVGTVDQVKNHNPSVKVAASSWSIDELVGKDTITVQGIATK